MPGSIAVGARSIYDEPIPMAPVKIVEAGRTRRDLEGAYLVRSRTPELNALDLLGQIAANRLQSDRIRQLCQRYGTDTVVSTMDWLVESTERRLRERLRELPDGRWRHVGFVEHDGLDDEIYEVRLTMSKVGDGLELDFTESSAQALGLINSPIGLTRAFVMATLMPLLGYGGVPWVPAAFERPLTLLTRPGTIVHATWPAGVSLGGTSSGHEVRTCINACLARMVGASGAHRHQVMASCMSSAPGQTIGGIRSDGAPFTSMLLDAQLGGGGARVFADGTDTSGLMHSPGGACANIEVNELNFPIRYLWRAERTDSGGPGQHRGGVGGCHAFVPHEARGPIELTLWAHGVEQPTGAGVLGGEPGSDNGFVLLRGGALTLSASLACTEPTDLSGVLEVPPAKVRTTMDGDDALLSWCGGGGGLGDPLNRDPNGVLIDVQAGLVSPRGAQRDYGVAIDNVDDVWRVDAEATAQLRHQRRVERLGGREPAAVLAKGYTGAGRDLDEQLMVGAFDVSGPVIFCRACGRALGPAEDNVKSHLVVEELASGYRWPLADQHQGSARFVVRRFYCPGCASQVDVEVNLRDAPYIHSTEAIAR